LLRGGGINARVTPIAIMEEIHINERDYRQLLEVINIALHVTPYHNRPESDHWRQSLEEFCDKILKEADRMGCGDLLEENDESGALQPTIDYFEGSFFRECLDDMAQQIFWEDLVNVLSERDVKRNVGEGKWTRMSESERIRHLQDREKYYWREFETFGIERLEVIPREPNG